MSKYDHLDASTELEQAVSADLKAALEKRGCTVTHNGSATSHAPGGSTDILVVHQKFVLSVEATKSKNTQQDREMSAIKDHLVTVKSQNPRKPCFCLYVSPETPRRMRDNIRDYNRQCVADGKTDMKILPLCFETLELLLTRWEESEAALYPLSKLIGLFDRHTEFIDDLRVRKLIAHEIFPDDWELSYKIEESEREADTKTLEQLIKDLLNLEDVMRQNLISTQQDAVANLLILVFLKVFEEKRERDSKPNRLRSREAFLTYRDNLAAPIIAQKHGIHALFDSIKTNEEFAGSGMFVASDTLANSLTDDFILDKFIPKLAPYTFFGTRVDALGAVYEVLSERAGKDVKSGQFFTPENVVRFMVKLAALRPDHRILDPACGTGRFLVYAMHEMVEKLRRSTERNKTDKEEKIRKQQLFGSDIDERIAKIAKMNMWIHGDGKSNIFGGQSYSGLTLYKHGHAPHFDSFDGAFDVILANPPLGDLNYQAIEMARAGEQLSDEEKIKRALERIPILPHKNLFAERASELQKRLDGHRADLEALESFGAAAKKIARKRDTIETNEADLDTLKAQLKLGQSNFEITGNTLKGGALFLTAMWNYLKADAYPDELPEWRGGRLLVILDEGILNTDEYRETRQFLRERYYIKAIISLTRDTFMPISKTATKTSIFYAVKKTDFKAKQCEPIFFGHVARTGLDTKGKATHNDFEDMLQSYESFERAVRAAYSDLVFRSEKFDWKGEVL